MKLLSFKTDGKVHVGAADRRRHRRPDPRAGSDPSRTFARPARCSPSSRPASISTRIGEACLTRLRSDGTLAQYLVANPQWLPPIPRPPKILALALNYQAHIDETNLNFYDEPIIFTKYSSNLIAHDADIELPPFPQKVDEEHELALVVGRNCRHIKPSEAADYIFGYTICNDVSARDRQRERMKMGQPYAYAKNLATFCPMGPWIVTAKELGDPRNLKMDVRINGKVTRSGNPSEMIFDPFEVLAYCSDYTPMEAGDIIALGTFSGDKKIVAGDVVELDIEKIGTLRNRVVQSKTPGRISPPARRPDRWSGRRNKF